jgi:hypothetical protein
MVCEYRGILITNQRDYPVSIQSFVQTKLPNQEIVFKQSSRENKSKHASAPLDRVPVVLSTSKGSPYKKMRREFIDIAAEVRRRLGI